MVTGKILQLSPGKRSRNYSPEFNREMVMIWYNYDKFFIVLFRRIHLNARNEGCRICIFPDDVIIGTSKNSGMDGLIKVRSFFTSLRSLALIKISLSLLA